MGKVMVSEDNLTFTELQKSIFDEFSRNPNLVKNFYFTGGTALSAIYLHHRESEDLDFFAERGFDNLIVEDFLNKIAQDNNFTVRFTEVFSTRIFYLVNSSGDPVIKIDFNYYPYNRIKKEVVFQGVEVDSQEDIAINKLMTINDRLEVKDYVDLYFLLQKFKTGDLVRGVKKKFRKELDLVMLASNFLRAEEFEVMPKMTAPLKLSELKRFFIDKAKELGKGVVEK